MANPQTEHGYTRIANELLEALARTRMPGEAVQVLLYIIRRTYGYNQKADKITLADLSSATGQQKPTVLRGIYRLRLMKIIIKDDNGYLSINKDHDEWKLTPKRTNYYIAKPALPRLCYICGFDKAIERHHIIPRSKGGPNTLENKVNLCPNCHTLVHRGAIPEHELRERKTIIETANENAQKQPFLLPNMITVEAPLNNPHKVSKTLKTKKTPKGPQAEHLDQAKMSARIDKAQAIQETAIRILVYLNDKSKSKFQAVEANLQFITGRLKEKGITEEICKAIIDNKVYSWLTKPMREGLRRDECPHAEYLRPATLFNRTKFWQYHGQVLAWMERQDERRKLERNRGTGDQVTGLGPESALPDTPEQRARTRKFLDNLKRTGHLKGDPAEYMGGTNDEAEK